MQIRKILGHNKVYKINEINNKISMDCFETGENHHMLIYTRAAQNHTPELLKNMKHHLGKNNTTKENSTERHHFRIELTKKSKTNSMISN